MRKPFEGLFGNTAELRLLDFLLPLEDVEFEEHELAEEANISIHKTHTILEKFKKYGILKEENGGYALNMDSPIVEAIDKINNTITAFMVWGR